MKKLLFICALIAAVSADAAKYTVSYDRKHESKYKVPATETIKVSLFNADNERIGDEVYVTEATSKTATVKEPVAFLEISSRGERDDYNKYRITIPQGRQEHDFEIRFSNTWRGKDNKADIKDLAQKFKSGKDTPQLKYLGMSEWQ